jgi:phosphoribosylglycinamide formyltransferase 1
MNKIAFCVSGKGRVVDAVLSARQAGLLRLEGCRMFVDRPSAALEVAQRHSIPCDMLDCRLFADKEVFRQALADTLCAIPVNGLFLTFDWLLPAAVINKFDPYIVNLHMSLLPLFKGRGAVEAAIQSGMSVAGVTYHRVALEMDEGPLIAQAIVPVRTNSVAKTLGFHLFKAAVPMGIQVARWFENGLLGTKLGSRVDVARTKFDSGPFFPRLDDDIAQYSTDYLNKHYPSDS